MAQSTPLDPVLLDKSFLSGVGLKKVLIEDEPDKAFYQQLLYEGKDLSVFIVSSETWSNDFKDFWFDEFIYMFHGTATMKPQKGRIQTFQSGDYFFAPKGYTGKWDIDAGENLEYELSVIATERADEGVISKDLEHTVIPATKLSGTHILMNENGTFAEVLREGIELKVVLKAEKPINREIKQAKDLFIRLLSGQLTITTENTEKTFYTGDFFIIPKGMKGQWASEGHGLIKYLTVETIQKD